jgi:geranylgeranyl pyrophosphate synthase
METNIQINMEQLIEKVEIRMRDQFSGYPDAIIDNLDQLIIPEESRIRPKLTLLVGNLFQAEKDALINLAAAVEMLHTATQIHNTLVDHSGQHRTHSENHGKFKTSATVLTGDLAFAAAAQLAAAVNRISVMQKFSETLQFIINGEITYLFLNGNHNHLEAYYHRIHAKTASIFEIATGMAAMVGTANEGEIKAAYEFGYNLGMAYQIMEDVQNFYGKSSTPGQQAGNDVQQGILTLPILLYQQYHADELNIQSLTKRNGNNHAKIEKIIASIRASDSIDQAIREAEKFIDRGLYLLEEFPYTPERIELQNETRQILNR